MHCSNSRDPDLSKGQGSLWRNQAFTTIGKLCNNSNIHIDMVLNHLGTDVLGAGNVSEHISYINWHHVKGQNYHKVNQNYRTHLSKIFFPVKRYQNNHLRWTLIGLLGFCIHPLKKFLSEKTFGSLPRF